jgi:hypothetical protein
LLSFASGILVDLILKDTPPLLLMSAHCIPTDTGRFFILTFNKQVKCLKHPRVFVDGRKCLGNLVNPQERHNLFTFELVEAGAQAKLEIEQGSFEDGHQRRLSPSTVEINLNGKQVVSLEVCKLENASKEDSITHCLPVEYWEKELESVQELLDLEPGCKCKRNIHNNVSLRN